MSSLQLAERTKLMSVSSWISHLRIEGVPIKVERRQIDGESRWFYWIETEDSVTDGVRVKRERSLGEEEQTSSRTEESGVLHVASDGTPAAQLTLYGALD